MSKFIIAYCSGGIGNRIATLIGAMYYAEHIGGVLKILWLEGPHCNCKLQDLFNIHNDTDWSFLQKQHLTSLFSTPYSNSYNPLAKTTKCTIKQLPPYKVTSSYFKEYDIVMYHDYVIPPYIPHSYIMKCLHVLKINTYILTQANDFINKHNIDNTCYGIHLRGTDCPVNSSDQLIEIYCKYILENKQQRFFVCSDSEKYEARCRELPNVISYPKRAYALYNESTKELFRSKESVQDAFIDLLVLSRTGIFTEFYEHMYTLSTFYVSAMLYKNVEFKTIAV